MNLPNFITLLRVIAIPFFAISLWYGRLWPALFIFIGAGLTDLLDGWIARRFNQRSRVGAILDPAADKLMMLTAFILMSLASNIEIRYRIPVWVAILSISRDIIIATVSLMYYMKEEYLNKTPSFIGKFTTGFEFVAISVGLLLNTVSPRPWFNDLNLLVFYLVAILVFTSGLHYFFRVFENDLHPPS